MKIDFTEKELRAKDLRKDDMTFKKMGEILQVTPVEQDKFLLIIEEKRSTTQL